MEKPRELDTAKIRAVSAEVECIVKCLQSKAKDLRNCYDKLHDEMYSADPQRDREFDKFLLEVAHVNIALDNLWALIIAAQTMQRYGLSSLAPRAQEVTPIRQSLVPAVGPELAQAALSLDQPAAAM